LAVTVNFRIPQGSVATLSR